MSCEARAPYEIELSIDSAALGLSAVLASTSPVSGATWRGESLRTAGGSHEQ